ncbi:phosphoribosylglycinamide formyltransferase [Alkalicoccus chagannorensis]|uniref:phosphoribosylglycinamide formyltransferase n=1 Tax=Alkalicoccus chagannorensis TaxID=427072 RepID=UPI000422740F|nr:phosphoribosylglycinamide formyltransferase [Alkalicoccus chagannorensis]
MRTALFASGSGSNVEAIVAAAREGKVNLEPVLIVCDRPGAGVEKRAERLGLPLFSVRPSDYKDKAAYERALTAELKRIGVELILLAGYMRLAGPELLRAFGGRMLNIHPSLLPSFPGLHAVRQALEAGVKVTGATVHLVDEGMDTGPIIAQKPVTIEESETEESLQKKIQQVEHVLYPQAVQQFQQSLKERGQQ